MSNMANTPLIIAFTPNYFIPAATTLKSLLDASDGNYHVICLVTEDIPSEMQEKLTRMGDGRLEFEYLNLGGRLKDIYTDPRYSEAASFRLLLPEILTGYNKVAYIDCDVIIRQDIGKLYESTDLQNFYLGVVYEAAIENQAERWKAIGCNPKAYFNSGFLLMNLDSMRRNKITEKLIEASKVDYLEFPDQDVLNQVCQGHVLPLSPKYNGIRTFFLPQYKSDFIAQYGSEDIWQSIQREATIHYTGGKPWNVFTVKFEEWWRTFDSLPQEIRSGWKPSKMSRLWKVYRTAAGRFCIDSMQTIYRKIKR